MKISAEAKILKEIYNTYKDNLKKELIINICNELVKYNIFINPPVFEKNGYVMLEANFFVLSYSDIDKLRELSNKYPEIKSIIYNIINNSSKIMPPPSIPPSRYLKEGHEPPKLNNY